MDLIFFNRDLLSDELDSFTFTSSPDMKRMVDPACCLGAKLKANTSSIAPAINTRKIKLSDFIMSPSYV